MGGITFLFVGLVAGALARLIVPGNDPMGVLGTDLVRPHFSLSLDCYSQF